MSTAVANARGGRSTTLPAGAMLALVAALQLIPFYVTITTATKARTDLSSQWLFPLSGFTWENFQTAVDEGNILRAIGNSALITVSATTLVCVLGVLAAYPLARRRTRLNAIVLALNVGLLMIPPLSILVPLYSFVNQIGGLNTYWAPVLVLAAGQLPLAVFLYTSFMRSLPVSIEEAASLDGAGKLRTLGQVVVPMLKPVTATVVILTSVNVWNEFALSGYLLTSPDRQTIAPATATFFAAQSSNLGAAAASALLAVVPIFVAYLFLQRYFISGMVAGTGK